MSKPKLYLPIGIFGSGKSTWARAQDPDIKIVDGDNIRWMLNAGEYIYNKPVEDSVHKILYSATQILLADGYDVILDECYCGLNRMLRNDVACHFADEAKLIAVVFPVKGMAHHVLDKVKKGLRGKTPEYWTRVYTEMIKEHELLNSEQETYFDDIIYV